MDRGWNCTNNYPIIDSSANKPMAYIMKTVAQIVEFILANNYPEASAVLFEDYCMMAGLDCPTERAKEVFDLLVKTR